MKNQTASKRKKLLLIIGIPVLIIGIILTVASVGLNTFLKPSIKKALSKLVVDGSDSLYTFSLGDYTVGMGGHRVIINNLNIQVDSNRYYLLKAANQLPPLIFSVKLNRASVTGLSPWDLWRHKNINCSSIFLEGSVVSLQQQKNVKDTTVKKEPKTLYEAIKPDINEISIGKIDIRNSDVTFTTLHRQTEKSESWHIEKMRVKLMDIKVDSISHRDTTRILYASNLQTGFDSLRTKSADGMYEISLSKTDYDFKKRSVEIEKLKLDPAISQQEFNRKKGYAADRFTINIPKITIENFNASALVVESKIDASVVQLSTPDISIYKDKTAGEDTRNKMGKYPHQELMKANFWIGIDSIKINDGKFTYSEKGKKTGKIGSMNFTNVNGQIPNITNQDEDIEKNNWCRADLTASFMGNNKMRAIFGFDLASKDGHFMVDANLASLQGSQINPVFRALAKAEMETFALDKLAYHAEGNDDGITGNMTLLYHDLKLNVMKEDDDGKLKKKGLITLIANMFKLYPDNPMKGEQERKATGIREKRIPTKNFFGMVIKTLLTCTQQIAVKGKNKTLPGLGEKEIEGFF